MLLKEPDNNDVPGIGWGALNSGMVRGRPHNERTRSIFDELSGYMTAMRITSSVRS